MKVASGYISDSYSKGRVRLTLGLRYDWQDDKALAATVPENPIRTDLLPSVTFDGADSGVTFRDWSPRAALTCDLRGNGKTIAKASFARYFGQGIFTAGTLNPVTSVQLRYAWADPNRDGLVQGNELGAFRQLVSGNWNAAAPGSPTTANQVSPDLKNDRTDEIIASLDHELMANFGVGFSYVYRNYDQFQDTFRIGISSADFIPVTYTETDSRFASRTPTVTYYQLRSGLSVPSPRVLKNYNFDRRYHGLELTARKRMSDDWMVNGSLTWNHTREHWASPDDYTNNTPSADPTNFQFRQDQPGSSLDTRWLFKVGGGYTFPLGINASAFLVGRDGFLRNESVQSPSRPGGLGRINVLFEPQGTNRYPTVWQADARVEKWFTFHKLRIAASLDVFNIGNVTTVVEQGNVRNTTNYGRVFSIIAPRVVRIGARLNF